MGVRAVGMRLMRAAMGRLENDCSGSFQRWIGRRTPVGCRGHDDTRKGREREKRMKDYEEQDERRRKKQDRVAIHPPFYNRRPRRPPFLRVESVGTGVVSSIRPIFMPDRANARNAL